MCVSRLDADYLNELPVLVLNVDDDFKSDRIKQEGIVHEVPHPPSFPQFPFFPF